MNVESELKNVEQTLWRIEDICPYGSEVDLAVRDAIRAVRNAITTEHEYRTGIKSSKKSIKSSLEDVLHEYRKYGAYMPGSYIEQLISTMYNLLPEDGKLKVDDFIHGDWDPLEGKMVPKNTVKSSTIKSSLEDRLVPYLEEFEEGYADALTSTDEMGNNARLETFYEMFKSDYNLSDDDISKLEGAVQDIWHETEEENAEHDMGEMYGAPHGATPEEALKFFQSKQTNTNKRVIKSNTEPYFYQLKDNPETNTRLGEMNCTYNLPDEEIENLYGSWFEIYDDEDLNNPIYKDAKPLSELTENDLIFVPGDVGYKLVSPSSYNYNGDIKFFG